MKEIYYNAPASLYAEFLQDDMSRTMALNNVRDYAAYIEWQKLSNDYKDEKERWSIVKKNLDLNEDDYHYMIQRGQQLANQHSKGAYFSISHDTFWDFYYNYKSDEECVLLIAYLALKSICGRRSWAKTCNTMWLARMNGDTKPEWTTKKGEKVQKLSPGIAKYSTNYGTRRLRALLFEYYHVSFYAKSQRGFAFSTALSIRDLIMEIRNSQSEVKRIDDKLKAAIKKAEETVNEESTNELPF